MSTAPAASASPQATTGKRVGRLVGLLLFLHLGAGLITPFILILPLVAAPDFLVAGPRVATQIRLAVFLFFVGSAMPIAIASAGWRVFRERSPAMALWLCALATASFTLQAVDNAHILSMLSLSEQRAAAEPAPAESFQALALIVAAARRWSHYTFLLTVGSWILLHFTLLFRFRFVPRWLAGLGIVGAIMQMAGVSVRGLLGLTPATQFAVPLAPIYVLVAVWLMVKGFDEPPVRTGQ